MNQKLKILNSLISKPKYSHQRIDKTADSNSWHQIKKLSLPNQLQQISTYLSTSTTNVNELKISKSFSKCGADIMLEHVLDVVKIDACVTSSYVSKDGPNTLLKAEIVDAKDYGVLKLPEGKCLDLSCV